MRCLSTKTFSLSLMVIIVLALITIALNIAVGEEKNIKLSLTLIPATPVSNQIHLDIRGAIHNNRSTLACFKTVLCLDAGRSSDTLHHCSIAVPAHTSEAVFFRWPVKEIVGDHQIHFVVISESETLGISQPIRVIQSDQRSTQRIGGAWIGFYHWSETEGKEWNVEIQKMTDQDWGEMVRAMHEIGMDIIVIQEAFRNQVYVGEHNIEKEGYQGKAFYPSRLYPNRMPIAANDPIEAILAQADKYQMYVFIGVGLYAWFDFTSGSLDWHKQVATELWDRYGHHRSFYGWYVSEEIAGDLGNDPLRWSEIVTFFREFQGHCRILAPDKPVMLAPNCYQLQRAIHIWPSLLEYCDIICPFGFHRMPKGDLSGEEAAILLQQLCDQANVHLWLDLEVFRFRDDGALIPRPIENLKDDLQRFANFEKILCYQFPGLLNAPWAARKPGGQATVRLYLDYKSYVGK